ncbi:autotransporter translocation and assembly factor TamB [Dysgonomonadaceae bacterium PH5-43]|nr:autotransporter translocation and assembly factor TamB [Dysgonomonadaceae bacterium PH5-43]
MKIFKYIVWVICIVVVIFYILPTSLLQVPYFQRKISEEISDYLQEKIETEVSIEQISFQPFNKLILKNIFIEDQDGDTLFSAKRVACGFDLLPLFRKKFHFSSAQLYTFKLHLKKESDNAPLNLQYIIDAFKSDSESSSSPIDVNIKTISLGHGTFSYKVKDKVSDNIKFNPKDMHLSNISAKINLHKLTNNELNADIKRLRFSEKSGFNLKHLSLDIEKNNEGIVVNNINIELPKSKIKLKDVYADFKDLAEEDNILEKANFGLQITQTKITLQDIAAFVPAFTGFDDYIDVQTTVKGSLNNLYCSDLTIKDGKDMRLQINANIKNLLSDNPSDVFVNANIKKSYINANGLTTIINNFAENPLNTKYLNNLGLILIDGNISGYSNNLHNKIKIDSEVGDLAIDVNFGKSANSFVKGNIQSSSVNLKGLLNNSDVGNAIFNISMDFTVDNNKNPKGKIDALINEIVYKNYKYENISLLGELTSNSFNGSLNAKSVDGQLNAEGLFLLDGENSEFNFKANASKLFLDKLNLTHKYINPSLSFNIDANFTGDRPENMQGTINIDNVLFSTEKGDYDIDHIDIYSNVDGKYKEWVIDSDLLKGSVKGNYSMKTLVGSIKNTLSKHIPSIIPDAKLQKHQDNNIALELLVNDTRKFSYILELPISFNKGFSIKGDYNSDNDILNFNALCPALKYKNNRIENGEILLTNNDEAIDINIKGIAFQKKNKISIDAGFNAFNDSIYSSLKWIENNKGKYKGELNFTTHLDLENRNLPKALMQFDSSELVFNDSLWLISPTIIEYKNEVLNINNFEASTEQQKINIDGFVSKVPEDELNILLDNVSLDYIFKSLNKKALTFGGVASGYVTAKDVYNTRQLSTVLNVDSFSFNKTTFGDLDLKGVWNDEDMLIEMDGFVYDNDSCNVAVNGYIHPVKEEISMTFDALNADATFLRRYLDNVVQNLSGRITGKLRLFGDLNNPTVEGDAFVKDGRFKIDFLNTEYSFSDWVRCTPEQIRLTNVLFDDGHGNKALANGFVNHKEFANFQFEAGLTYSDFKIFDATEKTNPNFYGPVFGSGSASIKGTEQTVNIDVSMNNSENTQLTLNFMEARDVETYNFINFKTPKAEDTVAVVNPWEWEASETKKEENNEGTEIIFNLNLNVNSQAAINMIMDPSSGDKITGYGNGNINLQYGSKTSLKVYGNYNIERGKYNFSFQQAIFRNFDIREGSTISFKGDPFLADLDIKAVYTVTANLGDLDQQLLQVSARNNVPIDCILLLNGSLEQPMIKFDLELPNSTAELERQVKSYIRTEDMLNRQIVYLLVIGRFYTSPEYTRTNGRYNNDLSLITNTLSNQITNILGTITDNVQVGTKFHYSGEGEETSTEVELLLSSTLLNNRLVINGNFGYVDNPYLQNNNDNLSLIGDFDVEYKLTPKGDIRLKGFNRYNYRNYFSTSPEMTQGVGVVYRKDFNNWKNLFFRKKSKQVNGTEN